MSSKYFSFAKPMQIRLSKDLTSIESVQSNIIYSLTSSKARDGSFVPKKLGVGKFANVFEATQQCQNQKLTTVAIKSLHARADSTHELLFDEEIRIHAKLVDDDASCYVKALDFLHLGPLFMSSCGKLFHPECPRGCREKLVRAQRLDRKRFPVLECPNKDCKYSISSEYIDSSQGELFLHPANPHAPPGDLEFAPGTIINFVDRRVIVMEKLGESLDRFCGARSRTTSEARKEIQDKVAKEKEYLRKQVQLLQKMDLMIQVSEAVERLHSKHGLIHRDLAPDNIMVLQVDPSDADEAIYHSEDEPDLYNTRFRLQAKLIDFGLTEEADALEMLPWYAREEVDKQIGKWEYMSPEALAREETLSSISSEDINNETLILPDKYCGNDQSPQPGDMIADRGLRNPDREYKIVEIQTNDEGQTVAILNRPLPRRLDDRELQLVRRLGRPHDVYSMGPIFYYILTGVHTSVHNLCSFTSNLKNASSPLDPKKVTKTTSYDTLRDSIPTSVIWADQIMLLILRAMIRGDETSFVRSRTTADSDGVRQFRRELKRLYLLVQREVIAWPIKNKLLEETSEFKRYSEDRTTVFRNFSMAMSLLCGFSIVLLLFAYYSFT